MTKARPVTPLHEALEQYGRRARRLSEGRMLAEDVVLQQLGDAVQLAAPSYREQLARRVVAMLRSLVEGMTDPIDRRIAEAVLATKPEFHDKTVDQRRTYVREHDLGFTDDQFKTRRARVISDLAADLAAAFRIQETPVGRIFIAGSYTDPRWDRDAAELGTALAQLPVSLISGMALPGRRVGYAMADALAANGIYSPSRIQLFSRANVNQPTDADRRVGSVAYFGSTQQEKRREMVRLADVTILFGGHDGTVEEAALAEEHEVPVIPLAFTGGAARQYWLSNRRSAGNMYLGGRKVEIRTYEALDHNMNSLALRAAIQLITQAVRIA
ncbi:hypothetical protein [Nocardia colli]|uniref:hypothetical protein n=1 Tax=Nocardia colli TaxID=2545717 RepID=UPI0035D5A8E9